MKQGLTGAAIGIAIAVVLLQWGWLALLLVLAMGAAGYALEWWLAPRLPRIKKWLRDGRHTLMKED
ncbi:hypothetical protein [Lacticaseibacillus zhaodongensis]|uniref:hypothetical protein n=1 Tax=Lacticaseibacillus zhaodongensis TaxID=2668065 RepID=UPI0012D2A46C|nr:hypothetical protein [Lacticaseibacillus zhaodongensis]